MMINFNFEKEWTKIWTTEYSLFSVWLFGREYIESCREEIGFGFNDIIFLYERGLATIYRDNIKQKEFVSFLTNRVVSEPDFLDKSIETYLDIDSKINNYINLPESEALKSENLEQFITLHRKFIAYFLLVLWSPNGLSEIDVSEEQKSEIFKKCEAARKTTEHTYPDIERFFKRIYKSISSQNADLLQAMLPGELVQYVKGEKLPSPEILKERYEYSVVLSDDQDNSLILGVEAKSIIEKISPVKADNITDFKGTVANQGKIRGRVRKIFAGKDMATFQTGEVLVTTMTRPEWLPVMKTAAAFVTDAGGILCHAAIVSRELDKPCIIGTKIATQVLNDGDLVEVDADSGVVSIIQKRDE